jgi:hypothetical protein
MFESWKPTLRKIISNIITLYTKILTFQMKSVCMYYRNRGFTFIRELAYWDNWDALLGDVVSAENDLIDGWKQYNDAQALEFRQNLTILTEEANCRLENINQTLQSIFHRQEQWRRNDEDESCLNDLLIVRPQDYMALIHKDETLVASACNWILREQSFTALTNWADLTAPQCRVLWIHGRAGTGKTMLVINVIENLSNRSFIDAANLAFCFCQSQSKIKEPLNSATSAIRSLMWMLLIQQPHLIAHLRKDYKELKGKTFVDHTALVILVRVFESMLQDADTSPVYFLVDALDECDEDSGMLRDLISRSLSLNANVRWLISSRPETKLLVFLKKAHEKSPTILNTLFEIDIEAKQDRIENYIAEKKDLVRQSSQGNSYNDEILDTVSSMVKEKAEGNLLYMSFVFKRLLKVRGEKAEQEIRNYPTGLTRLYSHKLSQIKKVDNMDMKYCLGCLVAISLADRSLSLAELESINPSPTDMKYLVLSCESMLDIEDNMVSVVHNSAKDYLTANQSDLQDGAIQGHIDIVRNSLHAMSNLKRDIYELGSYGIISKDSKPPNPDPLAAIAYSCEFWSKHLCSAEKENPSRFEDLIQGIEITNFLENHFLHWLESLSLQKKLYVAFDSIQKIISVAQVCVCPINFDPTNEPSHNQRRTRDLSTF